MLIYSYIVSKIYRKTNLIANTHDKTIPYTCTIIVIVLWEAAVTCHVSYQSRQDDDEIEIVLAVPARWDGGRPRHRLQTGHWTQTR